MKQVCFTTISGVGLSKITTFKNLSVWRKLFCSIKLKTSDSLRKEN